MQQDTRQTQTERLQWRVGEARLWNWKTFQQTIRFSVKSRIDIILTFGQSFGSVVSKNESGGRKESGGEPVHVVQVGHLVS